MKTIEILFVEDDSSIAFLVSRYKFWKENEFHIKDTAPNGQKALEYLSDGAYDLVITDIRMPVMDGMELLRKIRERRLDIGVILASNYADFTYAKEGMRLGAIDYIEKPYSEEKVYASLQLAKSQLRENDRSVTFADRLWEEYKFDTLDSIIQKTALIIHENCMREHLLDYIADSLELSKDYIGRLFKAGTGITLTEYVTRVKMELAKDMLKGSNMKVYQISQRLGYSTVDYFTRLFKSYTGMSPMQYKK